MSFPIAIELGTDVDAEGMKAVVQDLKAIVLDETGAEFPQDPYQQLDLAIKAVFASWFGKRARDYRANQRIPHDLGTAVNVMTMVFGNMGEDSGTGVAFSRNPSTGENVLFGEYLTNAQGEDVVAGIRTPLPIIQLRDIQPQNHARLLEVKDILEKHYREIQDLEFTIENGEFKGVTPGGVEKPTLNVMMDAAKFVDMANGDLDGRKAFLTRKLKVKGNIALAQKMQKFFFMFKFLICVDANHYRCCPASLCNY